MERIEGTALERHAAWIAAGQPMLTERLTLDLDRMFDAKRRP